MTKRQKNSSPSPLPRRSMTIALCPGVGPNSVDEICEGTDLACILLIASVNLSSGICRGAAVKRKLCAFE